MDANKQISVLTNIFIFCKHIQASANTLCCAKKTQNLCSKWHQNINVVLSESTPCVPHLTQLSIISLTVYVLYVLCAFFTFCGIAELPKAWRLCRALPLSAGYVLTPKIVWPSQCPAITLLWVPITSPDPPFFFHRWIFCCINPADQVGFVNVLNFNTLGHLSLRPNPGSVSDQTSYFLIWFGSKVAQERAKGEEGWWWSGVDWEGRGGGDFT